MPIPISQHLTGIVPTRVGRTNPNIYPSGIQALEHSSPSINHGRILATRTTVNNGVNTVTSSHPRWYTTLRTLHVKGN